MIGKIEFKNFLKGFLVISWINARYKCSRLKIDLKVIKSRYKKSIKKNNFQYSEGQIFLKFKERHKYKIRNLKERKNKRLEVFWVGGSQAQDESGFLQSLHKLAEVTVFYNHQGGYGQWNGSKGESVNNIREKNDKALISQIKSVCKNKKVDILLGQMWATRISKEALRHIQDLGIIVVNISMDDKLPFHWTVEKKIRFGSIGLASSVDMTLTTTPDVCAWYGVEGYSALFWPLASDPRLFHDGKKDIDVLFIGNRYGVRGSIINFLINNGIQVECYGDGWENGSVNARRNCELSSRAKIIFGIGSIGHCSDVYTLKLRDFDALMTGSLYITHRNPDLCNLFDEGGEFECYIHPIEALNKINFYLKHSGIRESIGRRGREKALKFHTWYIRLKSTFRQLDLI